MIDDPVSIRLIMRPLEVCLDSTLSFCARSVSLLCFNLLHHKYHTGPGCSKLTTSLVNDSLKFQMLIF